MTLEQQLHALVTLAHDIQVKLSPSNTDPRYWESGDGVWSDDEANVNGEW